MTIIKLTFEYSQIDPHEVKPWRRSPDDITLAQYTDHDHPEHHHGLAAHAHRASRTRTFEPGQFDQAAFSTRADALWQLWHQMQL
jgi:hypothetical protein